jgi:Sec-independent protein translocase protein TatA
MKILLLIPIVLLGACDIPQANRVLNKQVGEARHAAFVQCMELAAKITRQSDDNVAEVVSECSTQAAYITNYLYNANTTK